MPLHEFLGFHSQNVESTRLAFTKMRESATQLSTVGALAAVRALEEHVGGVVGQVVAGHTHHPRNPPADRWADQPVFETSKGPLILVRILSLCGEV